MRLVSLTLRGFRRFAHAQERALLRHVGEEYAANRRAVPRWIPRAVATGGLLLFGGALVGCIAAEQRADPTVDLRTLHPDGLALPTQYGRFNDVTNEFETTQLNWTVVASAEPVPRRQCEGEVGWVWEDREPNGSGVGGDPHVNLLICAAGSVEQAAAIFAATPIEDTVIPDLGPFYEAEPVSTAELDLAADEAAIACVWGAPDECRGWAYFARYRQYIVSLHFVSAGHGGVLPPDAFIHLAESVDDFAAMSFSAPRASPSD